MDVIVWGRKGVSLLLLTLSEFINLVGRASDFFSHLFGHFSLHVSFGAVREERKEGREGRKKGRKEERKEGRKEGKEGRERRKDGHCSMHYILWCLKIILNFP